MQNYLIYSIAITVGMIVRFSYALWIFKFNMPSFLILIIVFLNDGTIMSLSTDHADTSSSPCDFDKAYIKCQGLVIGFYLAFSSLAPIYLTTCTDFCIRHLSTLKHV